jgi:hypothetical protein
MIGIPYDEKLVLKDTVKSTATKQIHPAKNEAIPSSKTVFSHTSKPFVTKHKMAEDPAKRPVRNIDDDEEE